MLLVQGTQDEHTHDSHYLLYTILDYPHKNLILHAQQFFKGHACLSPKSIKLQQLCIAKC